MTFQIGQTEPHQMLPTGTYVVRATGWYQYNDQTRGKPHIIWTVVVSLGRHKGSTFSMSTPLGGENIGVLMKLINATFPNFDDDTFEPNNILDKDFIVTLFYPKLGNGIYSKSPRVADISSVITDGPVIEAVESSSGNPNSSLNLSRLAGAAWQLLK